MHVFGIVRITIFTALIYYRTKSFSQKKIESGRYINIKHTAKTCILNLMYIKQLSVVMFDILQITLTMCKCTNQTSSTGITGTTPYNMKTTIIRNKNIEHFRPSMIN